MCKRSLHQNPLDFRTGSVTFSEMVQELSLVSDPIVLHIWSCLHNYAYNDALFAAERLYAETHNSESLYILATSLYRIGRPRQVNKLLNSVNSLSPKSRLVS